MRIALFTDTFLPDVNGVARTLGRWVQYLESRGIACKVFAPDTPQNVQTADQTMVERFYSIPFLLYPECRMAIPNPIQMKSMLKAFNPTLIHVATPFNLGLHGIHYAKKHKVPFVASYHTHFDQYLSYYKLQWMEAILWKYMHWFHQDARKIYVPSPTTLTHLESKGMRNLEIWGRGLDLQRFYPRTSRVEACQRWGFSESKHMILFVGRLAPEKSVDIAIAAFENLPERVKSNSYLVIAGDGPLYKELAGRYEEDEDIRFTGFVHGEELAELYSAADVFLFPSATETFGNVVLEAMGCGTPVIGADSGGVRDNIQHGLTGLLCPVGNIDAFTEALTLLYDNTLLRENMAARGRAYSQEQTWDRIFFKLLESFEEAGSQSSSADLEERYAQIR
ncbi:glycosyl transferase [Paenibacillus swuensis]|uniref:Glycosyl transferase n=1 Tax=Paenibacillus swuensis TaxID=1178515 RepID=A0A172TGY1_9BACL|nr:glycosyltransferase family 1 protein [Paenibacillus swuensis]ANE46301.1 glycosyl transferase [Paenibacillus swuensis]